MVFLSFPVFAQLQVAGIFSSHKVLQRNKPVPVWSTTKPGNKEQVSSKEVNKPRYVRFDWYETAMPNLLNSEGFPCVPFRTDHF
jgi:hypothetical protein